MTTYRLINDIYHCHEAFINFKAMRKQFADIKVWFPQTNTSLLDKQIGAWEPVDVKFESDRKANSIPDISVWNLSCLVLNEKAYNVLHQILQPIGEFLALKGGFYLFNCLASAAADTIDPTKTSLKIEDIHSNHIPESLGFNMDKIAEMHLFKPGFLENSFLICQDELKELILANNLKGVIFEENLAQIFPKDS